MPAVPLTGLNSTGALPVQEVLMLTATLSPAIVNANTTAEQTFAVPGIPVGTWVAVCSKPTAQAGLGIVGCRVSAVDQVAITFCNTTAGGLTPTAAQVYTFLLVRTP